MIGFVNRADIPKYAIGFIVGLVILVVGMGVVSVIPVHGNWLAILFLVVFATAFKGGEWAGAAIWDRISSRQSR